MAEITKVSDLNAAEIAKYLRLVEPTEDDLNFITTTLGIAKNYIISYTGLKAEELDSYGDLIAVIYVLCQDMYDNRVLYIESNNINKVVEAILGFHQKNLL